MKFRFVFHSGEVEDLEMDCKSTGEAVAQHVGSDTTNLKKCEEVPAAQPEVLP